MSLELMNLLKKASENLRPTNRHPMSSKLVLVERMHGLGHFILGGGRIP